jgi:hypothetical protein
MNRKKSLVIGTCVMMMSLAFAVCFGSAPTSVSTIEFVDEVEPTLTIFLPLVTPAPDPWGFFDAYYTYTTSDAAITMSGASHDNMAIERVWWRNLDTGVGSDYVGDEEWTAPGVALEVGVNYILIVADDTSGNEVGIGVEITRTAPAGDGDGDGGGDDGDVPTISITSPAKAQTTSENHIMVFGMAFDGDDAFEVTWENSQKDTSGRCDEVSPWNPGVTASWSKDVELVSGTQTIVFTVTDDAGNSDTATIIVTCTGNGTGQNGGSDGSEMNTVAWVCVIGVIIGGALAFLPLPIPIIIKRFGLIVFIAGLVILAVLVIIILQIITAVLSG